MNLCWGIVKNGQLQTYCVITINIEKILLLTVKNAINPTFTFFNAQKVLFGNQYVRKWNVTCIASG